MGLFKKATRLGGRVAKNAAKQIIMPEDEKAKAAEDKGKDTPAEPQHSDAEFNELQEKYNALMTEKWKAYYKTSCEGDCETCEYYDWCPDDFDGTFDDDEEEDAPQAKANDALDSDADKGDGASVSQEECKADSADGDEDDDAEEDDDEEELSEEDAAAKAAAEAYYEDGCDGDCDNCEHYDWCPAEEEDEDDKVLFKGVTQGDVKNAAKGGVELARETALAARDLKEALDDITGGLNVKELLK